MRLLRALIAACALPLSTLSCIDPGRSEGPAAIRDLALPADAALDSAYRRGDATAVALLMSDSVVISAEETPDLVGRSTVQGALQAYFAANTVAAFTLTPLEIQVVGDLAFERGTFVWAAGPNGGSVSRREGRYMLLRVRDPGGVWKLHRYIENLLPAP